MADRDSRPDSEAGDAGDSTGPAGPPESSEPAESSGSHPGPRSAGRESEPGPESESEFEFDPGDLDDSTGRWRALLGVLGLAVYPHELVHYLAFRPWGQNLRIERPDPDDHDGYPLARVAGEFDPAIPTWAVRFGAVAPSVVFPLLAVPARLALGPDPTLLKFGLVVVLAAQATPSAGDLDVFLSAPRVREAGSFETYGPRARGADVASVVATVALTWAIAAILLL